MDAAVISGTPAVMVFVEASEQVRIRNRFPPGMGIREQQLLPSVVVRDTWLATDPTLVFQTVQHYHAHPEDRAELGTQAAVERIRQRRLSPA